MPSNLEGCGKQLSQDSGLCTLPPLRMVEWPPDVKVASKHILPFLAMSLAFNVKREVHGKFAQLEKNNKKCEPVLGIFT